MPKAEPTKGRLEGFVKISALWGFLSNLDRDDTDLTEKHGGTLKSVFAGVPLACLAQANLLLLFASLFFAARLVDAQEQTNQ